MAKQPRLSISIHPAKSADLPPLARLDIAANATHPLISQSFTYPFQPPKLFLAHLQFCFERPREYRFLVARLRAASNPDSEAPMTSDADSGVDVSLTGDREGGDAEESADAGTGEIVGFVMWRERQPQREDGNGEEEWDWLSRLPSGTDIRLWKRYVEVMSSDPGIRGDGTEIQKLAVVPAYQGRGIGTRLLRAFLEGVEGRGVIHARASRNATELYKRFGWKMAREFELDLRDWGRERTYVNFEMVRDA